MTVETTIDQFSYKPGAAMLPEAIRFQYLDAADIVATRIEALTGARMRLVPGTHYAIAGDGRAKMGTIRALGAWPADDLFLVKRVTSAIQKAKIRPGEPLPAEQVEQQLDRQAMAAQEQAAAHADLSARALLAAPGDLIGNLPPSATRRGRFLGFGADPLQPLALSGTGADAGLRDDLADGGLGLQLIGWGAKSLDKSTPKSLGFFGIDPFTTVSQQARLEDAFAVASFEGYRLDGHPDARIRKDGPLSLATSFDGRGCGFVALSDGPQAFQLSGADLAIRNFTHLGGASARHAVVSNANNGLYGFDLTNLQLENVTLGSAGVDGAGVELGFAGAGALFSHLIGGRINGLRVLNSKADGIHFTSGCQDVEVFAPYVYRSGDDGVAVVDYADSARTCSNIKVHGGTVIEPKARGFSVVGGRNIRYICPSVYRSAAAAFLFSKETGSFNTKEVVDAHVINGFAKDCVTGDGFAAGFSNAVALCTGTVTECSMTGRIEGIGARGNAGVSYVGANLRGLRFDMDLIDLIGTTFNPTGVKAGGLDCEGSFALRNIGGHGFEYTGGTASGRSRLDFRESSGIRMQSDPINCIGYFEAAPNLLSVQLSGTFDNAPATLLTAVGGFDASRVHYRGVWKEGLELPGRDITPNTPAFSNGWAANGFSAQRSADGMVTVTGGVTGGTVAAGTTMFTLGAGFRPQALQRVVVVNSDNTLGTVTINTNGTVVAGAGLTADVRFNFTFLCA